MAFRVNRVVLEAKPGKLEYPDGSVLNFRYRPMAYTPNHEDSVEDARQDGKVGSMMKAMLVPLIESWDVVNEVQKVERDEAGNEVNVVDPETKEPVYEYVPVPITEEAFGCIPLKVLGDMLKFISKDMNPGEGQSSNSEGSFG